MGPRAGLDRCGKSRPHRDSIPGPSSPQPVAIPTTLPGLPYEQHTITSPYMSTYSPKHPIHPHILPSTLQVHTFSQAPYRSTYSPKHPFPRTEIQLRNSSPFQPPMPYFVQKPIPQQSRPNSALRSPRNLSATTPTVD